MILHYSEAQHFEMWECRRCRSKFTLRYEAAHHWEKNRARNKCDTSFLGHLGWCKSSKDDAIIIWPEEAQ